MKREWKTIALGMGASFGLYLLLPLLCGYLMLHESIKENMGFTCAAVSAGLAAAVGMVLARRRACTTPALILALLVGPGVQLLAALLGYLTFPCGFAVGERRWTLFLISAFCAAVVGALLQPGRRKKRSGRSTARRRRI